MDVSFRRGTGSDAGPAADLYLSARQAARAFIPSLVHSEAEVRRWIAQQFDVPSTDLWVAESGEGMLVGLLVVAGGWVDQLYVAPWLTGRGIGSELLALATRERPDGLRLWTFESNVGAQRFYERHGFTAAKRTSSDNEEGAPDILYVWHGAD
jgi:ribosomal protein S18 acetylase RimI-like enzyme